jgi:acyl-CoA thioester hydrolase
MSIFRFYYPMVVRYGDLDAQGYVNNARYLTYIEQARVAYFIHLGLWDGRSFLDNGVVLADVHITFRQPILLGQDIRIGMRVCKIGNKSLDVEQSIEDASSGQIMASASLVLVAFDYHTQQSIPILPTWRKTIADFEDLLLD